MIDALHRITGMQDVPRARFVGVNLGSVGDRLADCRNCVGFLADNPSAGLPYPALASDNDDLALNAAAVGALGLAVCLSRAGSEVGAVDLDPASKLIIAGRAAHGLAQLVQQYKKALGVDVHVAGHAERRNTFHGVANRAITAR
jgi:hypothetical protein